MPTTSNLSILLYHFVLDLLHPMLDLFFEARVISPGHLRGSILVLGMTSRDAGGCYMDHRMNQCASSRQIRMLVKTRLGLICGLKMEGMVQAVIDAFLCRSQRHDRRRGNFCSSTKT
jgi:hypothetical protein